jgi:hypothetical protein
MGLRFEILDHAAPSPKPGRLTLTCDGHAEGEGMVQSFESPGGFLAMHRAAMAAGWKETFHNGERIFLGPCCSGKQQQHAAPIER